ncbi:MAG: NapC/NirT family cytochrome c [Hyphomicrobiaceae bacterium]|nr:NapC/NirT family cytochrome c [Hyphomicrobiaceae bacterium]
MLAPAGMVGLALGIVVWGGFNTALDATNSLEFCTSCHEMRATVYPEYLQSAHYSNPSGVRAICSDCHVPRDWTHKLIRKVEASSELYAKLAGTISTPEKFEARRLDLARHEWDRMRANDSRECRNCHSFEAMNFHKQKREAADAMREAERKGKTCIDCHKGIAHKLPDLTARHRAMRAALAAAAEAATAGPGERLIAIGAAPFRLVRPDIAPPAPPDGEIAPLAPVSVVAREGGWLAVELAGWQREGSPEILFAEQGKRIPRAALMPAALPRVETVRVVTDADTGQAWTEVRLTVWVAPARFTAEAAGIAAYGAELYLSSCSFCHALPRPDAWPANDWIGQLNAMKRFVPLDDEEIRTLLVYLQTRARDMPPVRP